MRLDDRRPFYVTHTAVRREWDAYVSMSNYALPLDNHLISLMDVSEAGFDYLKLEELLVALRDRREVRYAR